MKARFILFRRAGVFYCEDTTTRKQISLRTKDEGEALTLLHSKNESFRQPALNLHIARTYLAATDPEIAKRTWQTPMWHVGGSQTDVANLLAEDVDWTQRVISYSRRKTGTISHSRFGAEVEAILRCRPSTGLLFPRVAPRHEKHRAKEFKRRCLGLGIKGVTLHSYRYAWAERARKAGYLERFAQEALGHNSKAVHRAYARKPPLGHCRHPARTDAHYLSHYPEQPHGFVPPKCQQLARRRVCARQLLD
ncbi:MAG: hypothetical protein ACYDH9_27005 [Limisphaerales bacterium]